MPTDYIKKLSKEGKGSISELERKWDEAKSSAEKAGQTDNYAYITEIFQTMVGASSSELQAKSRLLATEKIPRI